MKSKTNIFIASLISSIVFIGLTIGNQTPGKVTILTILLGIASIYTGVSCNRMLIKIDNEVIIDDSKLSMVFLAFTGTLSFLTTIWFFDWVLLKLITTLTVFASMYAIGLIIDQND